MKRRRRVCPMCGPSRARITAEQYERHLNAHHQLGTPFADYTARRSLVTLLKGQR
jgi:hypothetical protein